MRGKALEGSSYDPFQGTFLAFTQRLSMILKSLKVASKPGIKLYTSRIFFLKETKDFS
jgi:hypothetical protein